MNIFDNLIDELKEENLLEQTVSESNKSDKRSDSANGAITFDDAAANDKSGDSRAPSFGVQEATLQAENEVASSSQIFSDSPSPKPEKAPVNQTEFFRKRAVEEVAGLQMVEHIFSGVERQQKKLLPKIYDDLNVKKALHEFLQIAGGADAPEHAAAEFQLMQETESWYSALSHRDKQISIAHLRRYCETTTPVLSSQALIALARFYRNSPYSEAVRSKFDLIVTRLFSKESGGEKREIVFERDDLMRHLSELYAEWESVSLYSDGEEQEESELLLVAFKFEDFMTEAAAAADFDELVRNDFFNRLRSFKQSTNEQFFAPLVTATAIESNVRIGNRYIELLEMEKAKGELEKLENKYGFLHDQVISDATSKTLQLVELLKIKVEQPQPDEDKSIVKSAKQKNAAVKSETKLAETAASIESGQTKSGAFVVNRWLLAACLIALFASIGIYVWTEYGSSSAPDKLSQDVKAVRLDSSSLNEFVRDARIGNNTFFAITKPSWETLNREKKEEILKKIAVIGGDKNFRSVHLLNTNGKTVGTVADGAIEINN